MNDDPSPRRTPWSQSSNSSSSSSHQRRSTGNRMDTMMSSSISSRTSSSRTSRNNNKRVLFFGDSFVRLFGLLQHADLNVKAFKGASAKGLGRDGNQNRDFILQQVRQCSPDRVLLSFGNVDVHLSYYYTKYAKEDGTVIDLTAVAEAYVEFAKSIPAKHATVHIIGVYPSPVKTEFVQPSLEAYGVIPAGTIIDDEDMTIEARHDRVELFNKTLQEACQRHNDDNNNDGRRRRLVFETANPDVLDPTTGLLKPSFQDVSPYNIHLVWETTLLLWLEKWTWLREFCEPGFQERMQKTIEEYLATKPWANANGEHIAANLGVGEAFDLSKST